MRSYGCLSHSFHAGVASNTMTERELFAFLGHSLEFDPSVALKLTRLPAFRWEIGPLYKVQYVIEFVGGQLIPSSHAKALLNIKQQAGFGYPEIFVTVPGQKRWRKLWVGDDGVAYDSLAFTWDLLKKGKFLTWQSANELLQRCERLAHSWNRRAIPLPHPNDVDDVVRNLLDIQNSLDIGVELFLPLQNTLQVLETGYRLGFRIYDSGFLEWRVTGWEGALLEVQPLDEQEFFDLKSKPKIEGISIGYSLPRSPSPMEILEQLFDAAEFFADVGNVSIEDVDGRLVTDKVKSDYRDHLQKALEQFKTIGLAPGSPEALKIFSP